MDLGWYSIMKITTESPHILGSLTTISSIKTWSENKYRNKSKFFFNSMNIKAWQIQSIVQHESSAKRKLIALSASIKKVVRTYTSTLTAHLKAVEEKEANIHKRNRQQEIFKLRDEINQVETKRNIQRTKKTRSWFFEKLSKINT